MTKAENKEDASLLENILQRPGMFWGNSDNHFHSFVAFISGYQLARDSFIGEELRRQLDQIIPPRFHEFVTEYYGHTFPHGGYGWMTFIEENSKSDREALELFMKLRQLYDDQSQGDQSADAPH